MSQSTDATLAFGYDLGEAYDYEFDWYNEEEGDFASQAEDYLLAKIVRFTEKWGTYKEGYWERKRQAEEKLGLTVDTHCSCDYPMYALVIPESIYQASRGNPIKIDHVDSNVIPYGWHDRIVKGMEALGIEPDGPPSWLLYSVWC